MAAIVKAKHHYASCNAEASATYMPLDPFLFVFEHSMHLGGNTTDTQPLPVVAFDV